MQKNIDGKVYDTTQSTMIATSGTLISLTGKLLICLYRTRTGLWFQTIDLVYTYTNKDPVTTSTLIPLTKEQAAMFARSLRPGHGELSH